MGSYSRARRTVSRGPDADRRQGKADVLDAAVEAAAGAVPARGEALDGGAGKGRAESAVGGFERAKTALDIETLLSGGECVDGLAEER